MQPGQRNPGRKPHRRGRLRPSSPAGHLRTRLLYLTTIPPGRVAGGREGGASPLGGVGLQQGECLAQRKRACALWEGFITLAAMTQSTKPKFQWTVQEAEAISEAFLVDHVHLIDDQRKQVLGQHGKQWWYSIMRAYAGHLESGKLLHLVCRTCKRFDLEQMRNCAQEDCCAWSSRPHRGRSRSGLTYAEALKEVCRRCPHGGSDERIQACGQTGCCLWTNRQPGGQPPPRKTNRDWYRSLPASLKPAHSASA